MLFNITGTSHMVETYFPSPLQITEGRICLRSASIWYSWHNLKNETLKYKKDDNWIIFKFYDGMYDYTDLIDTFNSVFNGNIILSVNKVMSKFMLKLSFDYEIDFSEGTLWEILGFDKGSIIKPGKTIAPNQPNITRGVDKVLIHCNLVDGSYISIGNSTSAMKSDILYSFSPMADVGSLIFIHPNPPIYFNTSDNRINKIRITLTDQNNKPIDINKETVNYELELC
jgi:hypothetical protein